MPVQSNRVVVEHGVQELSLPIQQVEELPVLDLHRDVRGQTLATLPRRYSTDGHFQDAILAQRMIVCDDGHGFTVLVED